MSVLMNLVFLFIVSVLPASPKMRYREYKRWPQEQPMSNELKLNDQDNPNVMSYSYYDIYYEPLDDDESYNEPSYLVAIKKPKRSKRRFSRNNIHDNLKMPKQKLLKYLTYETYLTDKVKECLDINIVIYLNKHKLLPIDKLKVNIYDLKKYEQIPIYELLHIMENQCRDIEYLLDSSVQEILNDLNRINEPEIITEISIAKVDISTELKNQVADESNMIFSLAQDLDDNYNVFMTDAPNIATNIHKFEVRARNEDLQNKSTLSNYDHVTKVLEYISNKEETREMYIQDDSEQVQTVTQNDSIYNNIKIDTTTDYDYTLNRTTQSEQVTQTNLEVLNSNENLKFETEAIDIVIKNEYNKAVTNNIQGLYKFNQTINTDSNTATIFRDNTVYPEIITDEMFENNRFKYILDTKPTEKTSISINGTAYPEIDRQDINAVNKLNATKHSTVYIITDNSEIVTQRINESINAEMATKTAIFLQNNVNPELGKQDVLVDNKYNSILNMEQTATSTFNTDTTFHSKEITQTHNGDNAFQNIRDMATTTEDIINNSPLYIDLTKTYYGYTTTSTNLKFAAQQIKGKLDKNNTTHIKADITTHCMVTAAASVDDFAQYEVSESIIYDESIEYLTSSEKSITLEGDTLEHSGVTPVEIVDNKINDETKTSTLTTAKEQIRYRSNVKDDLETTTATYLITTIDKYNNDKETNQLKNGNEDDEYITIIPKDTEITGQLYFHHNDVQIPLYFKQSLDGKVSFNINGTAFCNKLMQKMSKSLLIKALCEQ